MSIPPDISPPYGVPPGPPEGMIAPQQLSYARPGDGVVLTPRGFEMLRQTQPWVQFIGFVFLLVAILAIVISLVGAVTVAGRRPEEAIPFLLYVVFSLIYWFLGVYLRRYAARIKDLQKVGASEHLEAAMEAQKSFWRLAGIIMAVILGIYVVILIAAVLGVGTMRFLR